MVTFLEAGFFGYFNSIFVFLFILVVIYAILAKSELLGKNAALSAIVAFVIAALAASSSYMSQIFVYATPWIVFLVIILLMLEIIIKFLGAEKALNLGTPTIMIILLVIVLIIFMISAGQVNQDKAATQKNTVSNESAAASFPAKVGATLRTPAVLGLLLIFLLAVFAILLLTKAAAS